jgi:disulfide bond formation protein DsbB
VVWLPFLVAVVALLGSLWLSVGMDLKVGDQTWRIGKGLKACPLCFYQRTFVMGVVAVLAVGLLTGPRHRGVLNLLTLPLVLGGLGVAVFHVYLELTGKLECPAGVLGLGTAPQQSLAALTVLLVLVGIGLARSGRAGEARWPAAVCGAVLGLLLAVAALVSAPPMPPTPTKAYAPPFDMCRPPYHQQ